jgi:hypothetical protein
MERTLIGYRIRAKSGDGFVYLSSCGTNPAFPSFFWSKRLTNDFLLPDVDTARNFLDYYIEEGRISPVDMNGDPIEVSGPKVVAVYLRREAPSGAIP